MSRYDRIEEVKKGAAHVDEIEEVKKFNPYHDSLGRFSSAQGYASFTTQTRDPKKQHMADMAIARLKQQSAQQAQQAPKAPTPPPAPPKPTKNYDHLGFADHDDAAHHQMWNRKGYYQQQKLTTAQKKAADNYMEDQPERGSLYSHSQNMNHILATQGPQALTGKYQQTYNGLMSAQHNVGYNVTATRYDHPGFVNSLLQAAGINKDYTKCTPQELQRLVGMKVGTDAMSSFSLNDFANAPSFVKNTVFQSRAVKINGKLSAGVKGMMPGIGPGGDQGEFIVGPTNGTHNKPGVIKAVRLTGQMVRRKGTQIYDQPRIEFDIDYD